MGKSIGKISMYARKTNSEKILLWQKLFWNAKKNPLTVSGPDM